MNLSMSFGFETRPCLSYNQCPMWFDAGLKFDTSGLCSPLWHSLAYMAKTKAEAMAKKADVTDPVQAALLKAATRAARFQKEAIPEKEAGGQTSVLAFGTPWFFNLLSTLVND